MSESFWVKLTYKEYVGHYCEMTDAEIVADVRKSIGSFSNDRDDGNDFGAKMVRKANARMNGEAAVASRANGQKGGRPKKLTADGDTSEDSLNVTDGSNAALLESGSSANNSGAGEVPHESVSAKPSPALPVPAKKAHGEFGNVMLTDDEFSKLCKRFSFAGTVIEEADQYFEAQPAKKKKYKNHYAMLLNWCKRRETEAKPQQRYKNINDINQENYEKAMREIEAMCAGEAV